LTLDVKKSNSSNETPTVMTVGVEKYGLQDILSKTTLKIDGNPSQKMAKESKVARFASATLRSFYVLGIFAYLGQFQFIKTRGTP
jgi:hypothetical protein